MNEHVIWHDLECGSYSADLHLWQALAAEFGTPVLDVGAGTGRVSLALAAAGHDVIALDSDAVLLEECRERAAGLPVTTILADARNFAVRPAVPLCIVPMQTIQLLGGREGRIAFLRCARAALQPGGLVVIAIAEELEEFDADEAGYGPLPDICERDGIVYSSLPTAVRVDGDGFWLERRRECVRPNGAAYSGVDAIRLDRVGTRELEREGREAGLKPAGQRVIPPTLDYVGSAVVMLRA